ncbi:helix-turn-helix domain-containing protein [Roseobacter sp. N2S]|uniref:MarR family winged helix-turn-helix transcriptional regulator n=1 Tax=Roseobacter sp. N2S TaxID=2663844 RepID=UPI00285A0C75|nr:helix-turn-helix domain-containing protein [Roseobacter sp. N2S]MDR6266395.1 hypothetical protein [Roseobacter sp. N2S]
MSHKATNWLAGLEARQIGASEFRVLFHLCDCHNPSQGCFPTQAYLLDATGVSNGTLNNALNALEGKGLIRRHRAWDKRSKRQKPTRYILGFEFDKSGDPSPKTGDGKPQKPSPKSGDGAVSNLGGDPSPIWRGSRLQPTGEVTCKEPVINQRAARGTPFFTADERFEAKQISDYIRGGGAVNGQRIPRRVAECLMAENMIDAAVAKHIGLS